MNYQFEIELKIKQWQYWSNLVSILERFVDEREREREWKRDYSSNWLKDSGWSELHGSIPEGWACRELEEQKEVDIEEETLGKKEELLLLLKLHQPWPSPIISCTRDLSLTSLFMV